MGKTAEDITIKNLKTVLNDPEMALITRGIMNCRRQEFSGELGKKQLAECKATEKALLQSLELQVKDKLMPRRPIEDGSSAIKLVDTSTLRDTMDVVSGYLTVEAQIRNALEKVANNPELMEELIRSGLEARKNPTQENTEHAFAIERQIYNIAEKSVTIPKCPDLQKNLHEVIDKMLSDIIEEAAKKEAERQVKPGPEKELPKPHTPRVPSEIKILAAKGREQMSIG